MRIYKSFFRFEKCRKACKYRLYRLMRTYKEIVKNYILIYIKKTYLGGVAFSRVDWMIGLVIALLFFPVHELIHAVSFPAGSEVIMFYTTQGLGTTCTSPMTRNRFIVVNMLPSLILGVVPLIAYMIVPRTYAFASAVLCVFSLVHVGTGYVDYLNIVHLLRLPADSKIQISGAKIYWM